MKTFRFIGIALFAALMCMNIASCSNDDAPTEEKEENGIVVNGKKLAKIVSKSDAWKETITFSYDDKGRLIKSTETDEYDNVKKSHTYQYVWGDDAINVSDESGYKYSFTLKNGIVQRESEKYIFTYNKSNRIAQIEDWGEYKKVLWDGDKLVSIVDEDEWDATLTYEKSCKKGYFPFVATIIEVMNEVLFMAHPEIAGMLTTQLPTSMVTTYVSKISISNPDKDIYNFTYEIDKDGYVSKIKRECSDASSWTYTLTWK